MGHLSPNSCINDFVQASCPMRAVHEHLSMTISSSVSGSIQNPHLYAGVAVAVFSTLAGLA